MTNQCYNNLFSIFSLLLPFFSFFFFLFPSPSIHTRAFHFIFINNASQPLLILAYCRNWVALFDFQRAFLEKIQHSSKESLRQIANSFLAFDFTSIYGTYCSNQARAAQILQQCEVFFELCIFFIPCLCLFPLRLFLYLLFPANLCVYFYAEKCLCSTVACWMSSNGRARTTFARLLINTCTTGFEISFTAGL